MSSIGYANNSFECIHGNTKYQGTILLEPVTYNIWQVDAYAENSKIESSDIVKKAIKGLYSSTIRLASIYDLKEHFTFPVGYVKSNLGRDLNHRKYVRCSQYRELFVLDNQPPPIDQSECAIKIKPLKENCIFNYPSIDNYWFNSPLQDK